ncbi:(deoxy)nucleoside triphosphate pyrophosphohydrolase [Candidatus Latescibacterota bacterium]
MIRVTAAILFHGKKLLIAKRNSADYLGGLWEFPGGKIEPGETPEECLRRELYEEFNISVKVKEHFSTSIYDYDTFTIELMGYNAEWVDGSMSCNSHSETAWIEVSELNKYKFAPADIPFVEKLISNHT